MSTGARIFIIDDEPQIRRSLQVHLTAKGYDVMTAESGEEGLQVMVRRLPDVIVMDLLLPKMNGIELTQRIRQQSGVPIILLSAVGEQAKKVEALEAGADDYVTKPFDLDELLARIRSVLRRAIGAQGATPTFTAGNLSINFDRREVQLDGRPVKLTPTEYDLLKFMIENAGKVLTHRMILTAVWGPAYADQAQYLRVFVGQLRKKLEKNPALPRFILTDSGVGYRFVAQSSPPNSAKEPSRSLPPNAAEKPALR
jgi:two-component system KDP operon response regulator KdpE